MGESASYRLVVIESPYAGDVESNLGYLQACILDCATRGDSPYASHLMLTTALDDSIPEDRELGIALGLAWRRKADMRIFYIDRGWSGGMKAARELYERERLPYEIRKLGAIITGWIHECKHPAVTPKFDKEVASGLTVSQVRKRFPRFFGKCPDCDFDGIIYASNEHFLYGDW